MRNSIALLALLAARAVGAQTAPSALPISLVQALFFTGERATPRTTFVVGGLPAGWPAELTPPGKSIIGGMTDGRTMQAVFADSARRPLPEYFDLFRKAGFAEPIRTGGSGFMSSGGGSSVLCRDSAIVSAIPTAAPVGMSYVSVRYTVAGRSGCRPPAQRPTPRELDLPPLPPPAGMHSDGASGSKGDGSVMSRTTVTGNPITAGELLAHYARLLTAAGWTSAPATSDSTSAVQVFRAHDAQGRPWHGVLSVFATKAGREAELDMRPEEEPNDMFR